MLDSGADCLVIPKDLAELLNLDLNHEVSESYGIGGSVRSMRTTMSIKICKNHECYEIAIPVEVLLDGDPTL